ncbi:MAG: hypothetical protein D6768_00385, partial [Chloroflexi bacterium]
MSTDNNATYNSYAKFPAKSEIAAMVIGLLPFIASITSTSSRTVNGRVVESSYTDYVAIPFGIVTMLIALFSLTKLADTAPADRFKRIGAIVLLVLLGG